MKIHMRHYEAARDFGRARDFLAATYLASEAPLNWGLERWNWGRYHPSTFGEGEEDKIRYWEQAVRLWESEAGEIVGAAHVEVAAPGEAFIQRHPQHGHLLEEMLSYAEEALTDPVTGTVRIHIYDHDASLQRLAAARGYQCDRDHPDYDSEYTIAHLPCYALESGYVVRSMAEGGDLAKRCKVQGLGFNHPDPSEWTTPQEYRQVQQAPDYRPDCDLYVQGPDGEYVASCIVWYDAINRMGFFEPVSTHMGFRRRGFGRAVVLEGVRRVAALGATRARVGSGQPFYAAVGFERKWTSHTWTKERA